MLTNGSVNRLIDAAAEVLKEVVAANMKLGPESGTGDDPKATSVDVPDDLARGIELMRNLAGAMTLMYTQGKDISTVLRMWETGHPVTTPEGRGFMEVWLEFCLYLKEHESVPRRGTIMEEPEEQPELEPVNLFARDTKL